MKINLIGNSNPSEDLLHWRCWNRVDIPHLQRIQDEKVMYMDRESSDWHPSRSKVLAAIAILWMLDYSLRKLPPVAIGQSCKRVFLTNSANLAWCHFSNCPRLQKTAITTALTIDQKTWLQTHTIWIPQHPSLFFVSLIFCSISAALAPLAFSRAKTSQYC